LFVVATANGGKTTCTFEPSVALISTFPLLRSTFVISPVTMWCTAPPFVGLAFEHRTFFTRLHQFVLVSDAFLVAPGGIGTVLEMMMIWQLLQVRHLHDTPLILIGRTWPGLVEWARASMLTTDPPLAGAPDLAIPQCVPTGNEAVELIRDHHARWLAAR